MLSRELQQKNECYSREVSRILLTHPHSGFSHWRAKGLLCFGSSPHVIHSLARDVSQAVMVAASFPCGSQRMILQRGFTISGMMSMNSLRMIVKWCQHSGDSSNDTRTLRDANATNPTPTLFVHRLLKINGAQCGIIGSTIPAVSHKSFGMWLQWLVISCLKQW